MNDSSGTFQQLEIDYEAGLCKQFKSFKDVLTACAYGNSKNAVYVAAELGMTLSKLSRMLADNPNDNINFPAKKLPDLIVSTGDLRPVYWLVEKFLEDSEVTRKRAHDRLLTLLPEIVALLNDAKEEQ